MLGVAVLFLSFFALEGGQMKEIQEIIKEFERKEASQERKIRRWVKVSIEHMDYEGNWVKDEVTPATIYEEKESQRRVDEFKKTLTPTQLRRLEMRIEDPTISYREIARIENTDIKTIRECFKAIENKFKNFFK